MAKTNQQPIIRVTLTEPKKSYWLWFFLYPDNPYQMELLDYLQLSGIYSGYYIFHMGEVDSDGNEDKNHYHVVMRFPSQRTANAVSKMFGTYTFYHNPETNDIKYYDCPEGYVEKTAQLPHRVECISDPSSVYHYCLHEDFQSVRSHKILYSPDDIVFFGNILDSMGSIISSDETSKRNDLATLSEIREHCETFRDLITCLIGSNRYDLVEYCRKNCYFVKSAFGLR